MQNISISVNQQVLDTKQIINLESEQQLALASDVVNHLKLDQAISALEELIKIVPEQAKIWQMLAQLYSTSGNQQKANQALSQFNLISEFNQKLNQAFEYIQQENYQAADLLCRQLLKLVPNEIRTLRLMSKISAAVGRPDVCVSILNHCLKERPLDCKLAIEYIDALLNTGQTQDALDAAQDSLKTHKKNLGLLAVKAKAEVKLGAYAKAEKTYRKMIEIHPENSLCLLRLGNVLKIVGRLQEAIDCYHQALTISPDSGEAYWNLANTKKYSFTDTQISQMQELLRLVNLDKHNRIMLNFALGKALEDKEQFEDSFKYYSTANQLTPSTPAQKDNISKIRETFSQAFFAQRQSSKPIANEAIFIVGLPRSGSTLVEQILSSHSLIDGTMELTAIPQIVHNLDIGADGMPGHYPASVNHLTPAQLEHYAQQYLGAVRSFRQGGQYFIDKLPANFQHLGLINLLFPGAKIIDVRRHPMACGWSIYSQYFASGVRYAYDLKTIAQHYNSYVELMDHWHDVLPTNVLTINYEDLINNFKPTVQSLLDFCQVEMEDGCLQYFNNTRPVATPSAEQVRQAPYTDSLQRWRHFEPYLILLADALSSKNRT